MRLNKDFPKFIVSVFPSSVYTIKLNINWAKINCYL